LQVLCNSYAYLIMNVIIQSFIPKNRKLFPFWEF
jgi:hypothetical protein